MQAAPLAGQAMAAPVIPVATPQAPIINTGPIILLLLLPTLPLLLFSVGARPPKLSGLPFSSTDLLTTGACITIAGAVVLGLAIWPEGMAALTGWVRGAGSSGGSGVGGPNGGASVVSGGIGRGMGADGMAQGVGPGVGKAQWTGPAGYGGSGHSPPGYGVLGHLGQQGHYMRQTGPYSSQEQWLKSPPAQPQQIPVQVPRTQSARAVAHLASLRKAFSPWYSPTRPHLPTAVFVCFATLSLLFIGVGHLLGAAYDADPPMPVKSSSRSNGTGSGGSSKESWSARELRKRKEEKDEPGKTEERVKADLENERKERKARQGKMKPEEFEKWRKAQEKEREKEIAKLKKMLEQEGLSLVALGETGGGKQEEEDKAETEKGDDAQKGGDEGAAKGGEEGKKTWGARLKRGILGKRISDALEAQKAGKTATAGPGWEPANQAVVDATLAQSAANAEGNAERLKAEMAAR